MLSLLFTIPTDSAQVFRPRPQGRDLAVSPWGTPPSECLWAGPPGWHRGLSLEWGLTASATPLLLVGSVNR